MADKRISELDVLNIQSDIDSAYMVGISDGASGRISVSDIAKISADSIDLDGLWDRMYVKAKSVIIQCRYCNSHNAISNPTCVQCGAPLGGSTDGR